MSIVTERTKGGLRLRIVVSDVVWDRVRQTSLALGVEEREVLDMAIALGVRYLSLVAGSMSGGIDGLPVGVASVYAET